MRSRRFQRPGRGRQDGDKPGSGIGGSCKCSNPDCNYTIQHTTGAPCNQRKCPKCGSPLTRM